MRPELPIAATWPKGPAYEPSQPGVPTASEIKWQDFFEDQRLQRMIATALENNRDLRLAALNVQKARALYGIQRAERYPAFDGAVNATRKRVTADLSNTGERNTQREYAVDLGTFSWEIDFFGRLKSLEDQALQKFMATLQARRSTQILIVSSVAEAYFTLGADRENLKLSQTTFDAQKAAYDLIRRRQLAGVATELDLNRAQTQVDVARRDIAHYTQLVAQDENALNLLVGTASFIPEDIIPEDLAHIVPPKEISAGISSTVLLTRPDIMQAEYLLKAAMANIEAARASLFPRISLTATAGIASSQLSGLFEGGSGTWLFAPQAAIPIFDKRLWAALTVSKAERKIALTEYEKAIRTAFREVLDVLAVRGTMEEQLRAQTSLVRAASETYRLSNIRYTKGVDNYLSVLDAQRSLYDAQQALVSLRLADLVNQVRCYAVLGGGADGHGQTDIGESDLPTINLKKILSLPALFR